MSNKTDISYIFCINCKYCVKDIDLNKYYCYLRENDIRETWEDDWCCSFSPIEIYLNNKEVKDE